VPTFSIDSLKAKDLGWSLQPYGERQVRGRARANEGPPSDRQTYGDNQQHGERNHHPEQDLASYFLAHLLGLPDVRRAGGFSDKS
jgi:hypothetical protein